MVCREDGYEGKYARVCQESEFDELIEKTTFGLALMFRHCGI